MESRARDENPIAGEGLIKRWALPVFCVLAYTLGAAWRYCYIFRWHDPRWYIYSDMELYYNLGFKLAREGYKPGPGDVTHPPGMSVLTAWFFSLSSDDNLRWMVVLQFVLSLLAPLTLAAWAWAMYGRRAAWWALAAASLYFPFIDYFGYFLAEGYVTVLIPLVLALVTLAARAKRWQAAGVLALAAGVFWSVGIAFKLVLLPGILGFLLVYAVLYEGRPRWRRSALIAAALAIGMLPVMTAMSARATEANSIKRGGNGEWVLVSNKTGSDFLLGHYGRIRAINWRDAKRNSSFQFGSPSAVQRGYTEIKKVKWPMTDGPSNTRAAWEWIGENPGHALVLSCEHVYDLFFTGTPWPANATKFAPTAEAFQFVFVVLLFIPSVLLLALTAVRDGLWRLLRSGEFLVFSPILGVMAAVFITIGELRYRIPWDGVFILLAIEFCRRWAQARAERRAAIKSAPAAAASASAS